MMDNQELKDFIALQLGQLTQEINRLSGSVERHNVMMREIDIKTTTRIAELQKDVEEIRRDVADTRLELKDLGESQKFKWKALGEERAADKKDRDSKDRLLAVLSNKVATIEKFGWAIVTIGLGILLTFVWSLLVSGGIQGLIVP